MGSHYMGTWVHLCLHGLWSTMGTCQVCRFSTPAMWRSGTIYLKIFIYLKTLTIKVDQGKLFLL